MLVGITQELHEIIVYIYKLLPPKKKQKINIEPEAITVSKLGIS